MRQVSFQMPTPAGDADVLKIVKVAQSQKLSWPQTYAQLEQLAQKRNRAGALDVEVRRSVYNALKYNTAFYSFQFEE